MTGDGFYVPIPSQSHAVNSHSFPFPFPSWSLFSFPWDSRWVILISIPFPNTHSTGIKCKCRQSTVEQQKNSSTENWTSIVENKNFKNSSYNTMKIRRNSSTVILQNIMSVIVERRKCTKSVVFFHGNSGHSHSHLRSFPLLSIPIPKLEFYSHFREIPMGFPFTLGIPLPWSSLPRMAAMAPWLLFALWYC